MGVRFEKWEGLGNDFVIVGPEAIPHLDVKAICDRHRGVGADGVLVVAPPSAAGSASMRVINADGSEPEMCGNGLRCAALWLVAHGHAAAQSSFAVDTAAGLHGCAVLDLDRGLVRVQMRAPELRPALVPTTLAAGERAALDVEMPTALGRPIRITAVSMGNPHAVTFDAISAEERRALGPAIEADVAHFPARVNVGFARRTGARALELFVHERGAGWTEACGTGACAAAVAAIVTGRIAPGGPIEVTLPGGTLSIEVGPIDLREAGPSEAGAPTWMTGPARRVFSGEL